jgi:hypothetical protein
MRIAWVLLSLLLVGPGCAAGDTGGDVEREEAFSQAGITHQERDAAERDATGPEPTDAGRGDVVEADGTGDVRGTGEAARRIVGPIRDLESEVERGHE